ncbi:MAG TPA: PAS domain-containing protein [Gemmatimonadales bacterium]|nr:PAS domain-containing protein [Gemmatimonadales bacterium]
MDVDVITIEQGGSSSESAADIFLRGAGEMAALTRAHNWATTAVGPVETWSASLRATVSTLLASRHAMFLWWGPDLIQFYNDAYRPSMGPDRHPSALGARGRECWAEIWPIIGPEVEAIMAGGEATWHEDHLVPITRGDRVHDVYWSYSYSPVRDDGGNVGGVLVTVQETTRRVVSERRVRLLQELAAGMLQARSVGDVCDAAVASLGTARDDAAFALLYLLDEQAATLQLRVSTGIVPGSPAAPAALPIEDGVWPASRALARSGQVAEREWAPPRVSVVCDRWPEPVRDTLCLPLSVGSTGKPHGMLVVGLNPRLPADADATRLVAQVAREIGTALEGVLRLAQERASARAVAAAERELLAGVFELAPSFMAVLRGPEHVFELANPAYYQLVGHRAVLGRTAREAIPEVEGQGFFELLDRVYSTGEPFVGNEVLVHLQPAPGAPLEPRHLNFVYQAMRGADGEVTGILATGIDVTAVVQARRIVERALAETERIAAERDAERRQLRTVLEQAPIAIAITGPSGEILFANPTFERLWGRPVEETRAEDYSTAYTGYHLDGRPIASEEWAGARAVQRGEIVEGEVIEIVQAARRGASGRRLTVWISAAPVRDAAGRIAGGVVMFRDITAERRTEQQLRDAQRLQAVGTLAGGVAHEVNNALQGVLGFGTFVLRALGPEHPQSPDMRLVLQSAERAARVSQQLLAYTRQQVTQPPAGGSPCPDRASPPGAAAAPRSRQVARPLAAPVRYPAGPGGPRPGGTGPHQPGGQCAGRDRYRRQGDDRPGAHRDRLAGQRLHGRHGVSSRAGGLRPAPRHRHRTRHGAGDPLQDLRSVLHHQARGRRHGARPEHGLRHGEAARRLHRRPQRGGGGHHDGALLAGDGPGGSDRRRGAGECAPHPP